MKRSSSTAARTWAKRFTSATAYFKAITLGHSSPSRVSTPTPASIKRRSRTWYSSRSGAPPEYGVTGMATTSRRAWDSSASSTADLLDLAECPLLECADVLLHELSRLFGVPVERRVED